MAEQEEQMAEQEWVFVAALAVFALAGVVKGVVGLGMPTVSMALLALLMPAGQAAAWLLLPSLVTNVVQMRPVAALMPVLRRLWPMQAGIVLGTLGGMGCWGPVGALPVARMALGLALVAYAAWGLWGAVSQSRSGTRHGWGWRVAWQPAALPR